MPRLSVRTYDMRAVCATMGCDAAVCNPRTSSQPDAIVRLILDLDSRLGAIKQARH